MNDIVAVDISESGVAELHMKDEAGKNIFSEHFVEEFIKGLDTIEKKPDVKVLILKGLSDVFSGGAEKDTLLDLCDGKIAVKDMVISERLISAEFPVIAAMEGHAMGGGLVIGLCSDIVILARESRYGAVFMTMGFTPGMGCTTLLPELVGPYIASEMMYTGKRFKGSELEKKGVHINYILPKTQVLSKAKDIALQISERNVKSLKLLKYALSSKKKKLLIDARVQEDMMHRISFGFPETKEIIKEFYAE